MGKVLDLHGKRFGKLVAIRNTGQKSGTCAVWECQCDCGNICNAGSYNLTSGHTKSCGCLHKQIVSSLRWKNISGQRFGRLVALEPTDRRSGTDIVWKCLCDCGNICYIPCKSMVKGRTKSCGCYKLDKLREEKTTHGKSATPEYRREWSRKQRELHFIHDYAWTSDMENSLRELQKSCVICNSTINLEIDHVLPLRKGHGLKPGNAVVLCRHHNISKNDRSLDKLPKEWADKILKAAKEFEEYWNEKY